MLAEESTSGSSPDLWFLKARTNKMSDENQFCHQVLIAGSLRMMSFDHGHAYHLLLLASVWFPQAGAGSGRGGADPWRIWEERNVKWKLKQPNCHNTQKHKHATSGRVDGCKYGYAPSSGNRPIIHTTLQPLMLDVFELIYYSSVHEDKADGVHSSKNELNTALQPPFSSI